MIPRTPFPNQEIDPEIQPLVDALNSIEGVVTLGSCCGHGKSRPYVDFAVQGISGVRYIVAVLNNVQDSIPEHPGMMIDVSLNFSHDVATACEFETHPDWIMLSLKVGCYVALPTGDMLEMIGQAVVEAVKEEQ